MPSYRTQPNKISAQHTIEEPKMVCTTASSLGAAVQRNFTVEHTEISTGLCRYRHAEVPGSSTGQQERDTNSAWTLTQLGGDRAQEAVGTSQDVLPSSHLSCTRNPSKEGVGKEGQTTQWAQAVATTECWAPCHVHTPLLGGKCFLSGVPSAWAQAASQQPRIPARSSCRGAM